MAPDPSTKEPRLILRAWMHEEDPTRVISALQKRQAKRDGGASATSVKPYTIKLFQKDPK